MSRARDNAVGTMPGNIIQVNNIRIDNQASYSVSNSPSIITELNQIITPKYSNSKIMVQWEIQYECDYNSVFVIFKNGSVQSNGYNTVTGNIFYSGYAVTEYDSDVASTPNRSTITYFDVPGSTSQHTYQIGLKSASASNSAFYLNRPFSSTGANSYEIGVSLGYIMEIKQ